MSTLWSIIVNRMDGASKVWKEWRSALISVSSGPPDAGSIPMLNASGKIDPSMITGGGGGSTVSVNETPVTNPDFNNNLPAAPTSSGRNVMWQFDGSGHVSAYLDIAGTFSLDDGTFINPTNDFMFDDGGS